MAPEEVIESDSSADSEVTPQDDVSQEAALSSSAEDDKQPETEESLLNVVQNALDPQEEEEQEEPVQEADSSTEDVVVETDTEELGELSEEDEETLKDFKNFPPLNKHPRFKQLIDQRNQYRETAQEYDRIKDFMQLNSISAEDATEGFRIMALMKNNPTEAFKELRGKLSSLANASGIALSKDLKQKVDDGYIDEASARELSRTRAELARQKQLVEREAQQRQEMTQNQLVDRITEDVTDWEAEVREKDPDYDIISDEIDDRVRAMVAERGRPSNSEEAILYAQEAYNTVSDRHRRRTPQPKAMKAAKSGKLSGSPEAKPQSLREAIELAISNG